MAIGKPSRALSTLLPVPDNLKTPESMRTAAESMRMSDIIRMEAKTRLTQEVTRLLHNDRLALHDVRKKTKEALSTAGLEPDVLENKLVDAALKKLAQRRELGQDIGATFPAFKDYVPPVVYGKRAWGDEKQRLIELQLDMSGGRARVQRDEESDDEELNPYLKKEEQDANEDAPTSDNSALRGIKRDISSTKRHPAAQRYSEMPSASPKRRSTRTSTIPRHSSVTESNENDEYESDSESSASSPVSSSERDDDPNIPLIAVIRGQPIPKDIPTFIPSRAIVRRRKHRIAKDPSNTLKAVSRGEVVKKYDPADVEWVWVEKKGMGPRKRVRETEREVETRGEGNKNKNKKTKV